MSALVNLASVDLRHCNRLTSLPDLSHLLSFPALKIDTDYNTSTAAKTWVTNGCKKYDVKSFREKI